MLAYQKKDSKQKQSYSKKEQQKKSIKSRKSIQHEKQPPFVQLYHVDSIYSGQINNSHYRQGFGMLQTFKFHTFLGYFKNGRAQGLGLIILNSGTRIYGNFIKDQLTGMGLIDDGYFIKIGVWSKLQLNGIGYQYEYNKFMWRMVRYFKGIVSQVLKQEVSSLEGKMPTLINLEHSLYFFLLNYLENNYFPQQQSHKVHQNNNQDPQNNEIQQKINNQNRITMYINHQIPSTIYFGLLKNQREEGLGTKFDKNDRCVIQAGYYQNGRLNGFGFKNNRTIKHQQIGLYVQDKKEGLFMHRDSTKISYCLYHQNVYLQSLDIAGSDFIKKKQKQYNYQNKNFISQKNTLDLDNYENLVEKVCKNKQPYTKLRNVVNPKDQLDLILSKKAKQQVKDLTPSKNQVKVNDNQKTSVFLIKQKFKYFDLQNNSDDKDNNSDKKESPQRPQRQINKDNLYLIESTQKQNKRIQDFRYAGLSRSDTKKSGVSKSQSIQNFIAEEENPFLVNERQINQRQPIKFSKLGPTYKQSKGKYNYSYDPASYE